MSFFEKALEDSKAQLSVTPEERLEEEWTMRNGDEIYFTMTKAEVIRMIFCQIVHHRAQLGVFLRLLDIPIPGSYGPSADEMGL
ncbi:DinB family protein [Pseudarcicella hirudinis]|uniref:DinB family protein n=1 Tax=Pseudarcicella hirudinis TaxID=1079859 RepID=UPI0035E7F93A